MLQGGWNCTGESWEKLLHGNVSPLGILYRVIYPMYWSVLSALCACVSVHARLAPEALRRGHRIGSPGTELRMVVSLHIGAES